MTSNAASIAGEKFGPGRSSRPRPGVHGFMPSGAVAQWEWNLASGAVVGSEEFLRLLGISRSEFGGTIDAFLSLIHEDDRLETRRVLDDVRRRGGAASTHCRVQSANELIVALHSFEPMERDATGRVARLKAALTNVTHLWQGFDYLRKRMNELQDEVICEKARLARLVHEVEVVNSAISHDLRQPVRAVHGFAEVLHEDIATRLDGDSLQHFERIRAGAVRASKMIDALLALSRINVMPMACETVDLSAMCRDIARALAAKYPERDVEFEVIDHILVRGDGRMLCILLESLMDNAWKFTATREKARIQFSATTESSATMAYQLSDNGTGINGEWLGGICKPFRRLHADSEISGLGMGLALAAAVVHRHGGEVWYEPGPAAGSTFRFRLGSNRNISPQGDEDDTSVPSRH